MLVRVSNMRNLALAVLLSLLAVAAYPQKSAQNSEKKTAFKIEGTIRHYTGGKLFLHHRWDEKELVDSARVQNGKFVFNVKSAEPNLYWITTGLVPGDQSFYFFADLGNVKATLIGDSLMYGQVEAGQSEKDYLEYRAMINNLVMIQQKMQSDYNEAVQKNDYAAQQAIQGEYQQLNGQYINGLKNFIKTHPHSAVSGYIVYSDLNNPAIPLNDVEESLSYLDKDMGNSRFVKAAVKRVEDKRGTTVGYKATDFSQTTPDGKKVSLSDFRGKYVLVDFWASWCRPCRMENPNVVAAYNRFKDKGFTVLGVSMDSNKEPWVAAIQQDHLTWTHISDLKGWGNEVGKLYNVTGIPQNFLIDREGKIVAKDLRGAALDEKLAEYLK